MERLRTTACLEPPIDDLLVHEVIASIHATASTLTATQDSSNGTSVSGKSSFRATIIPCADEISSNQDTISGPASPSVSTPFVVTPPPFSALYYTPEESPEYIEPAVAEPDSCSPPPPFVPAQPTGPTSPYLSHFEAESKATLPRDAEAESSSRSAEEKEPPPPYSEGPSPLGSFTYIMAAAGGPASIITQVSPGGLSPPQGGNAFSGMFDTGCDLVG
ncbi:MAG: hypothetical protein Q9211_003146 [Gyalolechia sp. 1 TL-2023]